MGAAAQGLLEASAAVVTVTMTVAAITAPSAAWTGRGAASPLTPHDRPSPKFSAACFLAGTLVETERGRVPIEEIKVRDRVLARDDATGAQGFKEVLRLFPGLTPEVCRVTVREKARSSADGKSALEEEPPQQTIQCTPTHDFYRLDDLRWVGARDLRAGDRVVGARGEAVEVTHVAVSLEVARTYNLEVAQFHTYFVAATEGAPAVWVHNACEVGGAAMPHRRPGSTLPEGMQIAKIERPPQHHVFPQAQRGWFQQRGVDIDRYTLPLDKGTHEALHYGGGPGRGGGYWNNEIMARLHRAEADAGRQLTRREILAIGAEMRRDVGLQHVKVVPYGR